MDGVDLDAVAAAVRSCPGVDDLDGGPINAQLATYLPGRKIDGLKLTADTLTVQIRSMWDIPVTEVGAQIRLAVVHLVDARQVEIVVADLSPAPGYEPQPQPALHPEPSTQHPDVGQSRAIAKSRAGTQTVAPVAEPIIVERTVNVTETMVRDADTGQPPAGVPAVLNPVQVKDPIGQLVSEPEGELAWQSEPTTNSPVLRIDADDVNSSAPSTPTPGETRPRS
ncbi:MAG: hypothetical protein ABI137_07390 [Antricoccus sp.]